MTDPMKDSLSLERENYGKLRKILIKMSYVRKYKVKNKRYNFLTMNLDKFFSNDIIEVTRVSQLHRGESWCKMLF